mmetsp:Transcript_21124/g.32242  ORF Transcript_21124/g.32242 Transcript_21124/m.32242 type:complete len:777 (+) Transcript_21124:1-2331(+)
MGGRTNKLNTKLMAILVATTVFARINSVCCTSSSSSSSQQLLYSAHIPFTTDPVPSTATIAAKLLHDVESPHCWNSGCLYTNKEGSSVLLTVHGGVRVSDDVDTENTMPLLSITLDVTYIQSESAEELNYYDITEVLVDAVSTIDEAMGVTNTNSASASQWSIHKRGRIIIDESVLSLSDNASLYSMILSAELPYKHRITSIRTKNQDKAEIWEYVTSEGQHATALFVNDVLEASTEPSTQIHAEAMVHPAMVSHTQPTQILLVSYYNALPFLQQILKYESITRVRVLNTDMEVLSLAKKFMPDLDDCTSLIGIADECSQDERVVFDTVTDWEVSGNYDDEEEEDEGVEETRKYATEGNIFERMTEDAHHAYHEATPGDMAQPGANQYDIIYLDVPVVHPAMDKNAEWLFSAEFHSWLYRMCTHETMIVINSGHAPSVDTPGTGPREHFMLSHFVDVGEHENETHYSDGVDFEYSMVHPYDEEFAKPKQSSFLCVFVEDHTESASRFFRSNNANFDTDLRARLVMRRDELLKSPTINYDGPVHQRYSRPLRAWETWFCNFEENADRFGACSHFLFNLFNPAFHHEGTEVRWDPDAGRCLYSKVDIPKGHYVATSDVVNSWFMDVTEWKALNKFANDFPSATMYRDLIDTMLAYGYESDNLSKAGWAMSTSSNNTFTNHACHDDEKNTGPALRVYHDENGNEPGFLPPLQRRPEITGIITMALLDIKAGDEIKMDYRDFRTDMQHHPNFEDFLSNSVCKEKNGFVPVENKKPSHIEF